MIESGVKLILPYLYNSKAETNKIESDGCIKSVYHNSNSSNTTASERNPMKDDAMATEDYCTTKVIVCEGVLITVKFGAELTISGQLDGGGGGTKYAGQTAGYHARVVLKDGVEINVNGIARVLGFIDNESSEENPALVTISSTGTLYQPFVLRDFKGGSIMTAIYNGISSYKYSPFNQFQFNNINTYVRFNAGSKMYAYANLYAQSSHNTTVANVIGNSQDCLIELASGSYLISKYNKDTDVIDLHFYGGATTHSLMLTIMGMDLNSDTFVFPISWLYNITLDAITDLNGNKVPATYLLGQNFRMLPGSKMTVETGATLDVAQLSVYESFIDVLGTGNYPVKDPAILIVKGTLIADRLGGNVYATADGAKVTVTESVSVTTYEPSKHRQGEASLDQIFNKDKFAIDVHQVFTLKLKLYYGDNINGYTKINQEYTSETKTASDGSKISMWTPLVVPNYITLTITGNEGYTIRTDEALVMNGSTIVTDGFGNPVFTSYNSATDGARTIYLLLDAKVVFTLPQDKMFVSSDLPFTGITISAIRHNSIYSSSHDEIWYASETMFQVFDIVKFTVSNTEVELDSFDVEYGLVNSKVVITRVYIKASSGFLEGADSFDVTIGNNTQSSSGGSIEIVSVPAGDISIVIVKTDDGECVTPDTLITLADGTQVRVDSLTGNEMLLVWNLETGMLDYAPILVIDRDDMAEFEVIYLHFSDGTVVKVIYEHGFWDYDLNKYVYIDANARDYIGHYFAKQNGDELEKVQLVDVEIKTELTTAWSPVTVGHLCYFVNGMLSMPGGVGGLFNIFEVDEETMTYDYEAMAKDIETYGLFTYEELNAICPVSEELFNVAGGAYLKISIGKGNLTMEELIAMINRYSVLFE